jgi:hypothetical protein
LAKWQHQSRKLWISLCIPFEVETAIAKLENIKLPGNDKIAAELIQAGGEIFLYEIHKLIKSVWNKKELFGQWKECVLYQFTKRAKNLAVVIIVRHHCY